MISTTRSDPEGTGALSLEHGEIKRVLRRRGRPITTGEYVKKKEMALKEKVKILQKIEGINNPDLEPPMTRGLERLELKLDNKMSELRDAPTRDIIAESLAAADKVRKVAVSSGNLKRGYVKALNEAFLTLKSALTTISFRETRGVTLIMTTGEEMASTKTLLEEAREENMKLHEVIRELQRKLDDRSGGRDGGREKSIPPPPPSPPSPPSPVLKRTKRGPSDLVGKG